MYVMSVNYWIGSTYINYVVGVYDISTDIKSVCDELSENSDKNYFYEEFKVGAVKKH